MGIRIVLIGTTHPGNIGAAARAMKNMGFSDLTLVEPRHFPHEDATARASGAEDVLASASVVGRLEEAIADCHFVAGTSARPRSIGWPTLAPRECAARLADESREGKVALLFGPEKSGMTNDQLDRCHALVTIPTDSAFSSLNLAMAVQVLCYELRLATHDIPQPGNDRDAPLAGVAELERFYVHLEEVLTSSGFLDADNPRYLMRRLRRLFVRAQPDVNEINILRGILASLDPQSDAPGRRPAVAAEDRPQGDDP